ncbi:lipoprotein-releasing system transmembrane subunit, LolC/LolE family [Geothermobacter hydrogeniphilus]|uniref:Lipoprotein-releasing system transmembrane subunit, LolC/LolE family n=1 Tax=Geothermobacter hydrogeniphilus TaxID=1969733 RepID=A0A2K2HC73_9BACT|nr:lipoprotein-releasing ABC transporter permease subunit [Geothermobacter hydrogeniphilus]PNU20912.1 lipoprotein-releasing system transmembrane subunit, LolC/LolE family [Geothermobacter hydrogeniphilus]
MAYEWFVSLRYLRAKRKQTFISIISFISIAGVTLGVAALIVVLAVMTGFHDGVRQQILGNIPHVLIQRQGGGLSDYQQIIKQVRTSPHVTSVAPFVAKEAMLLSHRNVAAVNVKGIEPGHKILNQKFLSIDHKPVSELLFERNGKLPGIVIGLDTATSLGVAIGDSVNVIPPMFTITPFGMIPKMKPFRIVGIFRQGGGFLDTFYAYIDMAQAQSFFDSEGQVSGIEVEVDGFGQARPVAAQLRGEYHFPYVVRSWEDMFGSFLSALKLEKLGLFIVLGIIVLVAAFNIATTLIMVVMEKSKDIAILRSMGATSRSIMKIFLFEGLVIGVLGTGLGAALGVVLAKNADPIIKWLERTLGVKIFDQSVYGMDHFPSVVNSGDVMAVVGVALTICLLATIYPAWQAARMDPAEALRYE